MALARSFAALALLGSAWPIWAATAWDESQSGDFSGDGLAPTAVVMSLGSNVILGSTGDSGMGVDRDYFRFTVPDGAALTGLVVLPNTTVSGGSSFIGLQVGPQLTVSPTGAGASALLGFMHYGGDSVGQNLLPSLASGLGGTLPSGTYSVWIQEIGGPASYGFDFTITAVPEPGIGVLMAAGLLGLASWRRGTQR